MNIKETMKEVHENNVNHGFWENPREMGTLLMLVVNELSEALEADRKMRYAPTPSKSDMLHMKIGLMNNSENHNDVGKTIFEANYKDTFEDELADSVIRIFDICERNKIDLEWHIREKMNYNSTRPFMHGKKY